MRRSAGMQPKRARVNAGMRRIQRAWVSAGECRSTGECGKQLETAKISLERERAGVDPEYIEGPLWGEVFIGMSQEEDRDGCCMMGVLLSKLWTMSQRVERQ